MAGHPTDEAFMARALALAEATIGLASPNPQVGCVLVRNGRIIGEGNHVYDRYDHAEIVALQQATEARDAAAYVTLEPCSHHGRTGPCADALIAAGIKRCVVATADPNPQVSGRGIARLREAGIEVEVGLGEEKARALNDAFAFSMTRDRPFVTLKAGLSVDGRLAPPPASRRTVAPFFLTGTVAREEVQQLRHASDAILTGIGTVFADDPLLTDRSGEPRRRRLLRVVVDSTLRIPLHAKLLDSVQEDVMIFCGPEISSRKAYALIAAGIRVEQVNATAAGLDLRTILSQLHQEKVLSVLLEAGSALNGAFLHQDLVDRAVLYYAAAELGSDAIPFARGYPSPFALEQKMLAVSKRRVEEDVCVSGLIHDPWSL